MQRFMCPSDCQLNLNVHDTCDCKFTISDVHMQIICNFIRIHCLTDEIIISDLTN